MFKNLFSKPSHNSRNATELERYIKSVAAQKAELGEDHLALANTILLPITVRGVNTPGMNDKPWSRMHAEMFFSTSAPVLYSVSVRRESPDIVRGSLRSKRTLMEGVLMAAAEKTGRRPSMAETHIDSSMDAAESMLALGKPVYSVSLMAALFTMYERLEDAETARKSIEMLLKAAGLLPQRLHFIVEKALYYLQPGGDLFPDFDKPILFPEEVGPLLPLPSRQVLPVDDSVWVGRHSREGRDVYYSFTRGFDAQATPPPHATTLIFGEQGGGKTTLIRWLLLQRYMQGRTILSIDPEGENNNLCRATGGKVVTAAIPEDAETCLIHPLQGDTAEDLLMSVFFFVTSISRGALLTEGVQAALHEAVKRHWDRRPGENMTIGLLSDLLATSPSPDAALIRAILSMYQRGGILDGFFDRPRALLDPNFESGQWWNFDLTKLQTGNVEIVYSVLAWFMFRAITVARKPMDVFIDESWRLLQSAAFSSLLDELGRRARKRGVGIVLATHLTGDLIGQHRQSSSLGFATAAFVGKMSKEEAYKLYSHMGLSETEAVKNAELTATLPPRTFLATPSSGRGAAFRVNVTVPPLWLEFFKQINASTDGTAKLKE
jgi:hypothetical protein